MKTLHNHLSILLLILSFGALALLSGCASPVPVDLRDADGNIRPAPTATAAAVATLPETPTVVDTPTTMPAPTETATAVATATATVEDTATPLPTATATAEDTATPLPTATATAEDTATPMPTATATVEDTATPEPTATATSAPTKRPTATARATATTEPTLAAQVADTATPRPKATATSRPPTRTPTPDPRFTVAITEAELNKTVQEAIAQNDSIAVDNVAIDLQSGQIVASGRAKIGFFTVDLKIVATVSVSNGKAVPEITEIYVNGAPATGFVRQQVINMISPYLAQMTDLGTGVVVEKVVITDKDMTISGLQQ